MSKPYREWAPGEFELFSVCARQRVGIAATGVRMREAGYHVTEGQVRNWWSKFMRGVDPRTGLDLDRSALCPLPCASAAPPTSVEPSALPPVPAELPSDLLARVDEAAPVRPAPVEAPVLGGTDDGLSGLDAMITAVRGDIEQARAEGNYTSMAAFQRNYLTLQETRRKMVTLARAANAESPEDSQWRRTAEVARGKFIELLRRI